MWAFLAQNWVSEWDLHSAQASVKNKGKGLAFFHFRTRYREENMKRIGENWRYIVGQSVILWHWLEWVVCTHRKLPTAAAAILPYFLSGSDFSLTWISAPCWNGITAEGGEDTRRRRKDITYFLPTLTPSIPPDFHGRSGSSLAGTESCYGAERTSSKGNLCK